jgi:hypothetical protein
MNRSNWKGFERKVAKDFGTERTPLSGRNSKHTASDTLHEWLFIECKKRKKMAVVKLFDCIKPLAKDEGKFPVLAITETGRRGYLLVIDPKDLMVVANQYERAING